MAVQEAGPAAGSEPTEADITRFELQDSITLIWIAHRTIALAADEPTPCMQEVMDDLEKAANHLHQELHDIGGEGAAPVTVH